MAENSSNHMIFWLELDLKYKSFLGQIRHWNNLKMAIDNQSIWIKDFSQTQLESTELKSIPFAKLYRCQDNLLFHKNSLLPARKMPAFLWTPIDRALPVELENYNHNFFGISEQQLIRLVASEEEKNATVHLVKITVADPFINTAPAVRLKSIRWARVGSQYAVFLGEPLLPLDGSTFWQRGRYIFPVGYELEFTGLEKFIEQKSGSSASDLIWWMDKTNYCILDSGLLRPLSISSWRQTIRL